MCGIAGAVGYIDERVVDAVRRIDRAQTHRGPDGHGLWISGALPDPAGCVLAHRRLAILDPSPAGAQPMTHAPSGTTLVYNGEVYNFRELRTGLERCGFEFHTRCDTEVVLATLVQWGIAGVESFRGMFALAAWDPRRRQLALARDRLGIKPLYLMHHRGERDLTVFFASELRALLASGLSSKRIDRTGLSSYLWNGFVVGPGTIVEGIVQLPPGTHATIDAGQPMGEPCRYWRVPAPNGRTIPDELREELLAAVKLRLIADVPLSIFLSGGVDSSAVAALASRAAPGQVHTFNIGFDQPDYDESRYARAVAAALGTHHTAITLTQRDFLDALPGAMDAIDQPTFDAINTYCVSKAVRESGLKVALAGTGGDELFGGYRSFRDVPRAAVWSRRLAPLPQRLVAAAASGVAVMKAGAVSGVRAQTRWGKLADALATGGDLLKLYQVAYSLFTREFLDALRPPEAADNGTYFGLPADRAAELEALVADCPTLHAISALELSCFVGERLLRDTDAASMALALEVRVPLLDHKVIGLLAGLSERQRFEPLGRKMLLRQLALDELDPSLFDRPKSGFVMPFDAWCRRGLRDTIDDTLRDAALCRSVGLEPDTVLRLWQAFEAGDAGVYWSRVWALYVLLWWCRQHGVYL